MHPAFSVILFTTASGTGFGLLILLMMLNINGLLPTDTTLGIAGFSVGLTLVTAGLLASTFHLGRPERAWRALSQWRTSWLSREGVAALATYPLVIIFAGGWVIAGSTVGGWSLAGSLAIVLAVATISTTGMIYASLKTIPQWHNPLTVVNYLTLALAGGAVWLTCIGQLSGIETNLLALFALLLLPVSWALKYSYWTLIDKVPSQHDIGTATGLGQLGDVTLLEPPHTEPNFVQKEMGFTIARRHAKELRRTAVLLAFVLPTALTIGILLSSGTLATILSLLAVISISAGLLTERWLFFAEAVHVSMLFYGTKKA
ncbi:MAG: dimethyl sulfoxide reductase anchor subunit [Gammaproteobacteria bacterium]|nr:dimethyl sulfoxide reductase anchor subunit [Gammaproteobacteria bacterium]